MAHKHTPFIKAGSWTHHHKSSARSRPEAEKDDYRDDYNDHCRDDRISRDDTCNSNVYHKAKVSVPVAVKPFSFAEPTRTICCGDPVIKHVHCIDGCKDRICYFTISQEICVEIPIHFGARARIGETWVDCLETSAEDRDDCS